MGLASVSTYHIAVMVIWSAPMEVTNFTAVKHYQRTMINYEIQVYYRIALMIEERTHLLNIQFGRKLPLFVN